MKLSLKAEFTLGVYTGHKPDGNPDRAPSPERLYQAMLNAAAQGTEAVAGPDGRLGPSEKSLRALRWMEANPPDGLLRPASLPVSSSTGRFIYRKVSSINKTHPTEERRVSDGIAVNGAYGFQWNDVPDEEANTIIALANDIGCLGEAHSIAAVSPEDFEPNLVIDVDSTSRVPGVSVLEIPLPGRTDELIAAFYTANPAKKSKARERASASEWPISHPAPRRNVGEGWYRAVDPDAADELVPWTQVFFVELNIDSDVPFHQRTRLCVNAHRALISLIGNNVSPAITGRYLRSTRHVPANRLAFHYLPLETSQRFGFDHPTLAVFVPQGLGADEYDQVLKIADLTYLHLGKENRIEASFDGQWRSGRDFWDPPQAGTKRLWRTLSPAIPETKRVPERFAGGRWTLADSALLSFGFVWRDLVDIPDEITKTKKYVALRDFARERGVKVLDLHEVHGRTGNFVHHLPKEVTVQPWEAIFDLDGAIGQTQAFMVGQSRHLGGGLLVPLDLHIDESGEE